jgi:hypothetical protein
VRTNSRQPLIYFQMHTAGVRARLNGGIPTLDLPKAAHATAVRTKPKATSTLA